MAAMDWSEEYSVGIKEIDEQHQQWIAIYNRLHKVLLESSLKEEQEEVKNLLEEIYNYTCYHFASEEKLIQELGLPGAAKHWRLHKDFEKIVYEQYRKAKEEKFILTSEILSMVKKWLLTHILDQDKKIFKDVEQEQTGDL